MATQVKRRDVSDFTYGMDSTSFKGILSKYLDRSPLLQNVRLQVNGKARRRGRHSIYNSSGTFLKDETGAFKNPSSIVHIQPSTGHGYVIACLRSASTNSTMFRLVYATSSSPEVALKDNTSPTAKNVWINTPPIKMAKDFNNRIYAPGYTGTENIANGNYSGAIIDYLTPTTTTVRRWGIVGPVAAPSITNSVSGSSADFYPKASSPTDTGWYYFYTYIRKVAGSVVAESPPSPLPAARYAPTMPCKHQFAPVASTDPQVTDIRIYRTTGENGLDDGTAIGTAGFVKDVANASSATLLILSDLASSVPSDIIGASGGIAYYPYGYASAPKPAYGRIAYLYKDSIVVGGYDTYAYWTDQNVSDKFKGLFGTTSYANFYDTITSIFQHGNDIIVCTKNTTWRIVDGNWSDKRKVSEGIGVAACNSVAYDPETMRTIALTNRGVRAWDGERWGDDLSYQVKDYVSASFWYDFAPETLPVVSGIIVGREYYLSFSFSGEGSDTPLLIGFINRDGTISWTLDRIYKNASILQAYVTGGFVNINGSAYGIMTYWDTGIFGTRAGYLIRFDESGVNYDFNNSNYPIKLKIDLPRLIEGSASNYLRLRNIRALVSGLPNALTAGESLSIIASGDNGAKTQTVVLMQDTGDIIQFDGAFDDLYARSYIDAYLSYNGIYGIEFNTIGIEYQSRDEIEDDVQLGLE